VSIHPNILVTGPSLFQAREDSFLHSLEILPCFYAPWLKAKIHALSLPSSRSLETKAFTSLLKDLEDFVFKITLHIISIEMKKKNCKLNLQNTYSIKQ
jgi:hypothetical protein